MNRFSDRRGGRSLPGFLFPFLAFLLIFFLAFRGISSISDTADREEMKGLEQTVYREIVHCYASEGYYPSSIDYLKEHYGLSWNEDRYWIDYQPIGPNLMPDVTVVVKRGGVK
ncbi:MAG: hypothetical protein HFI68_01455 [Lachnospiraceae bacterium]|nr:hypothetical protein [Lachnospiraceae bacterium]